MSKSNYMLNGTDIKSSLITQSYSLYFFSSNNILQKAILLSISGLTTLKSKGNMAEWFKSLGSKARMYRLLEQTFSNFVLPQYSHLSNRNNKTRTIFHMVVERSNWKNDCNSLIGIKLQEEATSAMQGQVFLVLFFTTIFLMPET